MLRRTNSMQKQTRDRLASSCCYRGEQKRTRLKKMCNTRLSRLIPAILNNPEPYTSCFFSTSKGASTQSNIEVHTRKSFIRFKTRKIHFSVPCDERKKYFPVIEWKVWKQKLISLWRNIRWESLNHRHIQRSFSRTRLTLEVDLRNAVPGKTLVWEGTEHRALLNSNLLTQSLIRWKRWRRVFQFSQTWLFPALASIKERKIRQSFIARSAIKKSFNVFFRCC